VPTNLSEHADARRMSTSMEGVSSDD
jgi:hypothetical protein